MCQTLTLVSGVRTVHCYIFLRVQVFCPLFSMLKPCSESALNWVILAQLKWHKMCTTHQRQMARVYNAREVVLDVDLKQRAAGKTSSIIWLCFMSQDSDQTASIKTKKQPTYFEPGCCHRALSVALIQWDDSDDVLRVRLQAGEGVYFTVTGKLHRLYFTTFLNYKNTNNWIARRCKQGTTALASCWPVNGPQTRL